MNVQEIVNGWLFDYVCYIAWHEFSTNGEVGKEIRRFLDCIWKSGNNFDYNIRERRNLLLLVQILCALSDEVQLNSLTHIIEIFDLLYSPDKGPSIDKEMVSKTRRMLVAEAVLVCCKEGDFEKARAVYQHHQVDIDEEDDKLKIVNEFLESEEEKHPDFYDQSYKQMIDQIVLLLCSTYESFKTPMLIEAGEKYIQVYTDHTKQYESEKGDDASDEASEKSSTCGDFSPSATKEKEQVVTRSGSIASSKLLKSSASGSCEETKSLASTSAAFSQQNGKASERKARSSKKPTSVVRSEKRVGSPRAANELVTSAKKSKATSSEKEGERQSDENSVTTAKTPESNQRVNKENGSIYDYSSSSPKPVVKPSKRKLFNEENEETFEISGISDDDDEQQSNTPAFLNRINSKASTSRRHQTTVDSGSEVESDSSNASQQGPSTNRAGRSRHYRGKHQRKRRKWTPDEEIRFFKAVNKYGEGNWRKILSVCKFPKRTNVDLKDKWRNMLQKGQVTQFEKLLKEEEKS